jgi:hypothetical protein
MRMQSLLSVLVTLGIMLVVAACGNNSPLGPGLYGTSTASAGPAFTGPMPNEKLAMAPAAKPVHGAHQHRAPGNGWEALPLDNSGRRPV